jgi:hypothetical protein
VTKSLGVDRRRAPRGATLLVAFVCAVATARSGDDSGSSTSPPASGEAAPDDAVAVTVDPEQVTGRLADRYLGVTLDWQKPDDGVWPVDVEELDDPVLRRLMSEFGISDTMLDAPWWVDWIGIMAEEGTEEIYCQTLVGREYALVDQESLVPHPSFLVSVLHRRHADRAHLATTVDPDRALAHAYCTPDRNDAVTVTLSNPSGRDRDVAITVKGEPVTSESRLDEVHDRLARAHSARCLQSAKQP